MIKISCYSKWRLFTISIFLFCCHSAFAQPEIVLQPFASGFSSPLDVRHAGDERLFVVSRNGTITTIDSNGNNLSPLFLDITDRVIADGERGLLGLTFHPEFAENGYFYLNYTGTGNANFISRFQVDSLDSNLADSNSEFNLMTIPQPFNNHNGGDILFGPDGYLYIAIGDGGGGGDPQNNSQNRNNFLGKILRIDVDNGNPYSIPTNNPFADDDFTLDEIWALGLRNHWRNSFDRLTGDLWIADVGQKEKEEVNFQAASSPGGENYGWRCYEGTMTYNTSGCGSASEYVFPVFEYDHYGTNCSGSITGGYVYRGALFNGLFGKYLAADYCKGDFYWVEQTDTGFQSGLIAKFAPFQYSAFGEDMYGELYVTLLGQGSVQKITDTSDCRPVALILNDSVIHAQIVDIQDNPIDLSALYHPSLDYQWFLDNEIIVGADSHIYQIPAEEEASGVYTVQVTNPANACDNHSNEIGVTLEPVTYVANLKNASSFDFRIYPLPANNVLYIESTSTSELKDFKIQLFDLQGREVYHNDLKVHNYQINLSHLNPGMYFLKIYAQNGISIFTEKVQLNR